jgi:hypothetical protein
MPHNFIYIINKKLHNHKYITYTILFYLVIIHSFYCLYINLYNNKYIEIFIYFSLILLFYTKYKNFSYFIGYPYILATSYFIQNNIKENLTLREKAQSRKDNIESELEDNQNEEEEATPCEAYIVRRLTQRDLNMTTARNNTNPPRQQTGTTLSLPSSPPPIDSQLIE